MAPSETHPEHSEDRFHPGMKIPPTYQTPQSKGKVPQKTVTHRSPPSCVRRHCWWVCAHLEGRNHARPGAGAQSYQANESGPQKVTQVFRPCRGRGGVEGSTHRLGWSSHQYLLHPHARPTLAAEIPGEDKTLSFFKVGDGNRARTHGHS